MAASQAQVGGGGSVSVGSVDWDALMIRRWDQTDADVHVDPSITLQEIGDKYMTKDELCVSQKHQPVSSH